VEKVGKVKNYKDLIVWQKAHTLTLKIFNITDDFHKKYMYDLTSQLRRASLSIPTNIVEGSSSLHTKEFVQFLNISCIY
jgi:four helix bundle protein